MRLGRQKGSEFAVVDCETTGIHPSRHHRIVELAILSADSSGTLGECWSSLLRVDRDLGPTGIHGIRGRDLRDAPTFEEVLGEVLDRLAGRIVVAHNARFDCGFLEAELTRFGIAIRTLPRLCTMNLAGALEIGGPRLRLADCTASLGIAHPDAHCAEADARACAQILTAYLRKHGSASVSQFVQGERQPQEDWPTREQRAPARTRAAVGRPPAEPTFLASLVEASDAPLGADTAQVAPYLEVLDRAIEDRRLSEPEQAELAEVARTLNLSASRVRALHGDYVGTLIALAKRDRVVTERERHDLILVGEALGIPEIEELIDRPPASQSSIPENSLAGQLVCFTGALTCSHEGRQVTRELAQQLAEQAGLVVAPRVTKKLDILVVADPDSASGKAMKAREYGVRIVAEAAFWPMLGVEVS
jgi:DNA polymerase III subunit epsilon